MKNCLTVNNEEGYGPTSNLVHSGKLTEISLWSYTRLASLQKDGYQLVIGDWSSICITIVGAWGIFECSGDRHQNPGRRLESKESSWRSIRDIMFLYSDLASITCIYWNHKSSWGRSQPICCILFINWRVYWYYKIENTMSGSAFSGPGRWSIIFRSCNVTLWI